MNDDKQLIWEAYSSQGYSGEMGSMGMGTPGNPPASPGGADMSQMIAAGANPHSAGADGFRRAPDRLKDSIKSYLDQGKDIKVTVAQGTGKLILTDVELDPAGKLHGTSDDGEHSFDLWDDKIHVTNVEPFDHQ